MSVGDVRNRIDLWPTVTRGWVIGAQIFIASLFLFVGLFLMVRRLSGQLGQSPNLAVSALVGGILALGVWACWQFTNPEKDRAIWGGFVSVVIAVVIVAVSISTPNLGSLAGIWAPPFVVTVAMVILGKKSLGQHPNSTPNENGLTERAQVETNDSVSFESKKRDELEGMATIALEDEETLLDPSIDQLIIRSQDEQGRPVIFGKVRGHFAVGERTKNLHLAFCPPFTAAPQVSAELAEGPDADVQVGQAIQAGTRIDIKLVEIPSEPVSLVIEVYACVSE